MANFSTKMLGIVGTAFVFAGMSFGQLNCSSAAAGPNTVRAESANDVAGDIYVTCGPANGNVLPAAGLINIQLFAPTGVTFTSKVLDTTNGYTEAVAWHSGAGGATVRGNYAAANAVLGTISPSGNALNFIGIPAPVNGTYKIEISNIRLNTSGLSVTTGAPPAVNLTPVVSGGAVFQASLSSQQVAIVQYALGGASNAKGFAVNTPGAGSNNFVVCKTYNPAAVAGSTVLPIDPTVATVIRVQENFTTAFRAAVTEGSPLQFPGVGVPTNGTPLPAIGANTNAPSTNTRFKVTFANVPPNVSLYTVQGAIASTSNGVAVTGLATAQLTTSETGAFAAATAVTLNGNAGFAAIPVSAGAATAVFDITNPDPNTLDSFFIPIYSVITAGSVTPTATAFTATVTMGPTGSPANQPNFNASAGSTVTLTGSKYSACSTSLLFPFVTNQLGFDTGIAIANTATDPFGANGAGGNSGGTCTLNFYGQGAPSPANSTTANIPSGTVWALPVSGVAAGFQGYVIAQCAFQYAHGFAFITNGVGVNGGLSQGYLAGVIPDVNQINRAAGVGEILGN